MPPSDLVNHTSLCSLVHPPRGPRPLARPITHAHWLARQPAKLLARGGTRKATQGVVGFARSLAEQQQEQNLALHLQ